MEVVTVEKLIRYLQTFPMSTPVAYALYSEARLIELKEIKLCKLQPARPDGWIHDNWYVEIHNEPILETIEYLLFPGN